MFNLSNLENLKVKPVSSPWPKGLLIFFIILFIFVLGVNFVLKFYLFNQERALNQLTTQFENLRSSLSKEKEEEILRLEKKIEKLSILLNNHISFSLFFDWLEKYTHPNIYYTSLEYSLDNLKVSLSGISKSNLDIAQGVEGGLADQMINSTKMIEGIVLRNIEVENVNQIKFSLDVYLKLLGLLFKPSQNINQNINQPVIY